MSDDGSEVKSLKRSTSLPYIPPHPMVSGRHSPFFDPQSFVTCDIRHRTLVREGVGDHKGNGKFVIKHLAKKKMGFMAAERGLEWERPGAKAMIPKDKLPSIPDVIKGAIKDLKLDMDKIHRDREDAAEARYESIEAGESSTMSMMKRDPSFGGSGLHRCGPKLPLNRPKPALDLLTPPPSPPPPPKEPRKKKKLSPKKAGGNEMASVLASLGAPKQKDEAGGAEEDEEIEEGMDVPWTENELKGVFFKFDSDRDNELECEDLLPLLRYLGAKPEPEDVDRIVKGLTQYATIEWDEFLEFIRLFREFDLGCLRASFKDADADGSGKLNVIEVEVLLRKLGFAPTVQTVHEAIDAVDNDKSGDISFREFENLREYIRKTEGLTKQDIKELYELFERAAGGEGKDLNTDEIWRITMFRGYANSFNEIKGIASEVDSDGTGTVSFAELLKVIRRVREIERDKIIGVLKNHGEVCGSKIMVADLGKGLNDLGYYVSEDTVFEILETIGETVSDEYLTLDEFMAFLRGYRRTEGFSQAELAELQVAFEAEDIGKTDSINALELGRVLRSFGFSRTLQQVQRQVEEIDFDGSGELEIDEFQKLMRQLLQGEAKKRRDVIKEVNPGMNGIILVEMMQQIVKIIDDVEPEKKFFDNAMAAAAIPEGQATITIGVFEVFYKHFRRAVVENIRTNAGYGPKEVIHMRAIFDGYDSDKSGTIERAELQKLIAQYFPDATKSRAQQIEIQKILASFDTGAKAGGLDFTKYIWLMRKCDDMRDEADVVMEAEVVAACNLSVEEVEGFRSLFSSVVTWTGELNCDEITELMMRVVDLTDDEVAALQETVKAVHPHQRDVARFPQFIKLIKKLVDDNLLGVNDAANRSLKRASVRKQRSGTKTLDAKEGKKIKQMANEMDVH